MLRDFRVSGPTVGTQHYEDFIKIIQSLIFFLISLESFEYMYEEHVTNKWGPEKSISFELFVFIIILS